MDLNDDVIRLLFAEGNLLLPGLTEEIVVPWVEKTRAEVLAGRTLSAGPSRKGEAVQVRFRLGQRLAVSYHHISYLRDQDMDFFPATAVALAIRAGAIGAIVRPDRIQDVLKDRIFNDLMKIGQGIPANVMKNARSPRINSANSPNNIRSYDSDVRRMAYDMTIGLKAPEQILAHQPVSDAMDSLINAAALMIVLVPYHSFSASGDRLKHENAKRRLLKAMKAALLSGVTDKELEDIKNEALVNQIMS